MEIKVREPNTEDLTSDGIPRDAKDIMQYFNKALESKTLPWIPRTNPITIEEIKELWVPSYETNINIVAELKGKVVGSATVFYNPSSSSSDHSEERGMGNIGATIDPSQDYQLITKELAKGLVQKLQEENKTALWRIAIESPSIKTLDEMGLTRKETTDDSYKVNNNSGNVVEYTFP